MAGAPFELTEALTTPKTIAAAQNVIAAERELSEIKKDLRKLTDSRGNLPDERRSLRKALHSQLAERLADISSFEPWRDKLVRIAEVFRSVDQILPDELTSARQHLR